MTNSPNRATADFSGSVAMIVGCDETGIWIARDLASRGAAVGLCGNDPGVLEGIAGKIAAEGGKVIAVETDGAGEVSITNAVDRVLTRFGTIDILINNPGVPRAGSLADVSPSELRTSIDANVTTPFFAMQAVIPSMRARRYGRIINIFSLSYLGLPGQVSVSATHAALFGLTRSISLEAAVDGISVNAVAKGDTDGSNVAGDAEKPASQIPVRRMGTAADVAYAVRFFVSPSAKYVTGQTLFVCGGKSAYFSMSA